MTSRVRLIFRSVSEVVGAQGIGLLVLTDSAEQRQVVMPCRDYSLDAFALRMEQRGKTDKMLPEVLWNVLQWQTNLRLEVHIDSVYEEKYQAVLCNIDTLDEVAITAVDAVLLSYVSRGDIPVMMEEQLFMRQSTVYDRDAEGVQLPINTITDEMLRSALDKAVTNENYEMASLLRDELKRREVPQDGPAADAMQTLGEKTQDAASDTDAPASPDASDSPAPSDTPDTNE